MQILCFSLIGCAQSRVGDAEFLYHDDGTSKPRVAIVAVFDNSGSSKPCNIAEEFTESITAKVVQSGKFYLTQDFDGLTKMRVSAVGINPFVEDVSWIREMDSATQFVVFTEILQYELDSSSGSGFLGSNKLHIALRVKVLDIRSMKPRVILQEIFQDSFSIPWKWGTSKAMGFSPLGLAHRAMVKRAAQQIQDYILLAHMR